MSSFLDLLKIRSQKQYTSSNSRASHYPIIQHTDATTPPPPNPVYTNVRIPRSQNLVYTDVRKSQSPNPAYAGPRTSHSPNPTYAIVRTTHRSTPRYTKVQNHNYTGIVFSKYQEELNNLWHISLLQYKSSMNEITAMARVKLASTVDAKTSKSAVDEVLAELKKTSLKNLEQYMQGIFKLIERLPAEEADPIVNYWRYTSEYYGGAISAFEKAFFATMGVILEANAKSIMQCDRLEKETSAIYGTLFT